MPEDRRIAQVCGGEKTGFHLLNKLSDLAGWWRPQAEIDWNDNKVIFYTSVHVLLEFRPLPVLDYYYYFLFHSSFFILLHSSFLFFLSRTSPSQSVSAAEDRPAERWRCELCCQIHCQKANFVKLKVSLWNTVLLRKVKLWNTMTSEYLEKKWRIAYLLAFPGA